MKIATFWIVPYPECYDTLGDIFHEQPAETLHHWILGATSITLGLAEGRDLGVAYYTEREGALADAVARLGNQAGIDAADGDYRAGTRGEIDDPYTDPCPARGDDRGCAPGHPDGVALCMYCGTPVALEAPIDGALEIPDDVAPRHRAAAVRVFVKAYNEQMRALLVSEEA